jgi:hypothetical protein
MNTKQRKLLLFFSLLFKFCSFKRRKKKQFMKRKSSIRQDTKRKDRNLIREQILNVDCRENIRLMYIFFRIGTISSWENFIKIKLNNLIFLSYLLKNFIKKDKCFIYVSPFTSFQINFEKLETNLKLKKYLQTQ